MTLSQNTIEQLKLYMAQKQDRLQEDIQDDEVFEYVNEVWQDEQDDSVKEKQVASQFHGGSETEYTYTSPRTRNQIIGDMIASLVPYSYVAWI